MTLNDRNGAHFLQLGRGTKLTFATDATYIDSKAFSGVYLVLFRSPEAGAGYSRNDQAARLLRAASASASGTSSGLLSR